MAPEGATPASGDLLGRFRARLEELDGTLHVAPSLPAARATARELIGGATVARWADDALDGIVDREQEATATDAEFSLILADVAVAATGAVGFAHRAGRPRSVGVLPPRQVALLDADDLVADVISAFVHVGLRAGDRPLPGNVVFAAGPSRTSDIEQRSIRGVHAPRDLAVVIFHR